MTLSIGRRHRGVMAALAVLCLAASCGPQKKPPDRLTMDATSFDRLPGWRDDALGTALDAFRATCGALAKIPDTTAIGPDALAGTAADWRQPCATAAGLDRSDETAVHGFFETAFTPFRLANNDESEGLFTGYYEAELHGSRTREAKYTTPLLKRPPDLVMVELGLFRPAWRGERIAGRVEGGQLKPYASRAEIERGRLDHRNLELFWVDDPIDAFFLQIQGPGGSFLPTAPRSVSAMTGRTANPTCRSAASSSSAARCPART